MDDNEDAELSSESDQYEDANEYNDNDTASCSWIITNHATGRAN